MKHEVKLNQKQANDLKWGESLQLTWEFLIIAERDGSITVVDERETVVRKLKSMQDFYNRNRHMLLVPEAKAGDEIEMIFPDGSTKSFVLPR